MFARIYNTLRLASGTHRSEKMSRPLYLIAQEIRADWKNVYFGAVPYLQAMATLDKMSDNYGLDTAQYIVQYFLANAQTWRGEVARNTKKELKAMVKNEGTGW
jgi:hypothetical protein